MGLGGGVAASQSRARGKNVEVARVRVRIREGWFGLGRWVAQAQSAFVSYIFKAYVSIYMRACVRGWVGACGPLGSSNQLWVCPAWHIIWIG